MPIFSIVKEEFKRILQNKILLAIFIGIAFSPLLYGTLNLWSMWDIHEKIDKIPVAVVNLDKGFMNQEINKNLGSDLVRKLKDNTVFNWRFVDKLPEAREGLENNEYYAMIVMPVDFSAKVFSVTGNKPQPAKLEVVVNEYY